MVETRSRTRRRTARPGSGTGASRRKVRTPRLTRTRPRGVVAATTGLLGLSSTRRAAILALVFCAVALTVAVPLRNYVSQRQELAAVSERQQELSDEVAQLREQRARLSDPAETEAEARSRLGYVMPGEVPYVVQLPPQPAPAAAGAPQTPWYHTLWRELAGATP